MSGGGGTQGVMAIVLAGGTSSRMGQLGALLPKSHLPVSRDQTLLTRTLDQLWEAGLSKVIVSTSPEQYPQFTSLVTRYRAMRAAGGRRRLEIYLIQNEHHVGGTLKALAAVVPRGGSERVLMCFADIWFASNPYVPLIGRLAEFDRVGAVIVHHSETAEDFQRGAITFVDRSIATRFVLAPPNEAGGTEHPLRWSGVTLFADPPHADLAAYFVRSNSTVEEDFLNFQISLGRRYVVVQGPPFVNVNSFDDFLAIILKADRHGNDSERPS